MKPWLKIFCAGYLAHMAIQSLAMDFMGKTGTIQSMQSGWISPWVTVPLAALALIVSCRWAIKNKDERVVFDISPEVTVIPPPGMDADELAEILVRLKPTVQIRQRGIQ